MKSRLVVRQECARTIGRYRIVNPIGLGLWFSILAVLAVLATPAAWASVARNGMPSPMKDMSRPNGAMAAKIQAAHKARAALKPNQEPPAPPIGGNHPTVMILIENPTNSVNFASTLRDPKLWTARLSEIARYYREVSKINLLITPARESQGTANDGIIGPIVVPEMLATTDMPDATMLVPATLRAATQYIDYASFDRNNDNTITADELHIVILIAGYEMAYDPYNTPLPRMWAHMNWQDPYLSGLDPVTDSDGVNITSYVMCGSQFYDVFEPLDVIQTTVGTLIHELGHDLGMPDLYDADGPDSGGYWSGLGDHSLMASGNWGGGDGSIPVHLDGFLKSWMMWTLETVVQAPTEGTFRLNQTVGTNEIVRINVFNSPEFFIVENRQHVGFDRGLPGTLGGLAIYHCDGRILQDINIRLTNSVNLNPYDAGIKIMQADGSDSLMNPIYRGSDADYYRVGNNTTFNELTNPNSDLKTGVVSDVDIFEVSTTGPQMTFKLTSGKPRVGFSRTTMSISESQTRVDVVVNLSKKAENLITVGYRILGGTATGGADYTLNSGLLYFYPGQTSKYFTLTINNDSLVEVNETILLGLGAANGALIDTFASTEQITIVDNDQPYLNLVKPNGGERIARGTSYPVAWNSDLAVAGSRVRIDLYKGGNFYQNLAPAVNNTGATTLVFPATLPVGFDYKLAIISETNTTVSDQSDGNFAIIDGKLKVDSFLINYGAATASSRTANLNNRCSGTVNFYMASESASFAGGLWQPYSDKPKFALSPGDGVKTVYFKVKNTAGQESNIVSDTITLKEALLPPKIEQKPETSILEHQPFKGPALNLLWGKYPIMWSLIDAPAGMKINPGTGEISWTNPVRDDTPYYVKIRAENAAGHNDMTWIINVIEGNLGQGLDNRSLTWTYYWGDAGWFYQRLTTHDGMDAAGSRPIGHGKTSVLNTVVTGPGVLTFQWKVSSEPNWDRLSFYIGEKVIKEISGEQVWKLETITLPAGKHTLSWAYSKDASNTAGKDAGYVDEVSWTPGLRVSGLTRPGYAVKALYPMSRLYSDRYVVAQNTLPEVFYGQTFIQTAYADLHKVGSNLFSFTVDQPVTAILAIDPRFGAPPQWASTWTPLATRLETSESRMKLYAKRFAAGKITLGGNSNLGNAGDYAMYGVILLPNTPVPLDNLSNRYYSTLTVHAGLRVYGDRDYLFKSPISPLFFDQTFIRTRNNDKNSATGTFLSFEVSRPVTVILALDARMSQPPSWAAGWQPMADPIYTTEQSRKLYAKRFAPGKVMLGGNVSPGTTTNYNMYSVLVLPSY